MMSSLTETIVIGISVAVAAAWAVRAIWRAVRGGKACSSCSSSGDCPLINQKQNLAKMGQLDQCGPNTYQCPDHQKKPDKT